MYDAINDNPRLRRHRLSSADADDRHMDVRFEQNEHVIQPALSQRSHLDSILSEREFDVVECMAKGMSNPAIARKLFIQDRTVERHISAIFSKLNAHSYPGCHPRVLVVLAYLRDSQNHSVYPS